MTEQATRTRRTPLGSPQAKLGGKEFISPGCVGRWINDRAGRLVQAKQAGYTHVEEKDGTRGRGKSIKRIVGTHPNGEPMHAYLMEIKKEFYDEDQAAKLQPVDEIEAAIRSGVPRGEVGNSDAQRFYVPSEGISIRRD